METGEGGAIGAVHGGPGCREGSSSEGPIRRTATAHTLKAGIRENRSNTGLVSSLTFERPAQWNGAKMTSGRTTSVTRARKTPEPRRVLSSTNSLSAIPQPTGQVRVHLGERVRLLQGQRRHPTGLGAALVLLHHSTCGEHVRIVAIGLLGRLDVIDPDESGPPIRRGEPVGEQAWRADRLERTIQSPAGAGAGQKTPS